MRTKGTKSWIVFREVLKAGKWKATRITLGTTDELSLSEARDLARDVIAKCKRGDDPSNIRRERKGELEQRSADTYATVREQFLTRYIGRGNKRPAPRTLKEMQHALAGDVVTDWDQRPITTITERDIIAALDQLIERGANTGANRTLAYLKLLFGWARSRRIIEADPTADIRKPGAERPRERFLTLDEIKALWRATDPAERPDGDIYGPIVRVLLLTGQRRAEVSELHWSEIEGDLWTIPPNRTKNGRPHAVPLSDSVLDIIEVQREQQAEMEMDAAFVFATTGGKPLQTWSREKRRLDEAVAFNDWTLHDIRRSVATHLDNELHISPWIVESILNHQSGTKRGVAGTYNRSERINERRSALDAWARFIHELSEEATTDNLIQINRKR